MKRKNIYKESYSKVLFLLIIFIALIGIISNPKLSISSAASGVGIWFNIVLPSLLPFFIISEVLIGIGFVDFIGKLLQPLMRPLFNVPGEGAFPLTMSILSGYPVGAKLTSRLREEGTINKNESDRLICFTSTSGPLFMLGAVSIGMLNDPKLSPLIILPHYISILILGLLFRSYKSNNKPKASHKKENIFEGIQNSYITWLETKKSIGSLITKAVKESMDTILLIGGLVIFYSVLVEILFSMDFINSILSYLGNSLSIDSQLIKGVFMGLFEVTIGCKNIAALNISFLSKILIINFIIGWSGFSVHSQALSFISNTDINTKLYILSKFFHGVLSSIFGYIIYLLRYQNYTQPTAFYPIYLGNHFNVYNWLHLFTSATKLAIIISLYIFLFSIFTSTVHRILKGVN